MKRLSNPKPHLMLLKCLPSYSRCTDQSLSYEAKSRQLTHSFRGTVWNSPETIIDYKFKYLSVIESN